MRCRLRFIFWVLPVLGFVLGYAYAYIFFHGLLQTWHFIGKPDAKIMHILGSREARRLLVETGVGEIYSFGFADGEKVTLPSQLVWEKEENGAVDPGQSLEYYGADFFTWPPPFQVVQLYELEYLYRVEGKGELKFVLAADGNLWMWNHQIAGLTGTVFYFYPVMGFLASLVVALAVYVGDRLIGKKPFIRQ